MVRSNRIWGDFEKIMPAERGGDSRGKGVSRFVCPPLCQKYYYQGQKAALIHSAKYNYYKFPEGGIENRKNPMAAMIRETREESGLAVLPDTVKEYGYVHRRQRSGQDETECFIQDSYYYFTK